ncbi:helix-turn-helix domain-containing protein [Streptomyces pratens]|uniref:Helix-turn-helix domain-containing protein n=1 Tax=Streptomyces pratens TaxID=887456 RepID=A0ABW1LYP4_9ACTN
MDTENPSAPPRLQSADGANRPLSRATRRPPVRPSAHPAGVTHENTRHTTRFTVIGNHLAQHRELSLLAIGLACHLQSLPTGAAGDIKTLTARFPEGSTRIAAALRELEAHGYLRRERRRTPTGRIVTRTVSCNQPGTHRPPHSEPSPSPQPSTSSAPAPAPAPADTSTPGEGPREPRKPKKQHPLPPVPQPSCSAPALLQQATHLLAGLRHHTPGFLLSACDTEHLTPGVAAWLERDVTPTAVRRALTTDLPPEGVRRPAALLAHRLTAQFPPPPPFRTPADPPTEWYEMRNCDGCERGFRAPESQPRCHDCLPAASNGHAPS